MKSACVNRIQNFQRIILAMLEQVTILNVKSFSFLLIHMQTQEKKKKKKICK